MRTGAVCLLLLAVSGCATADAPSTALDRLRQADIEIASGAARHAFRVWIADTDASRSRGLMFVRELAANRGMLFLFEPPQFVSFWMKNTYVPLDLLFIGPDGRIVNIIEQATPLSTAPLEGDAAVASVLEVPAGTAAGLGIRAGDRLLLPVLPAVR